MKILFSILFMMAFAGGLTTFWNGFHETVSGWFGCMRYTYEVIVLRHCEDEVVGHPLVVNMPLDKAVRAFICEYMFRTYPEYVPGSIVSITLVEKRSVVAQTLCRWLYRACTRTADDAVREWKEQNGIAV